jgi:hypothetical protein
VTVLRAIAVRPSLWWPAVTALGRLARDGWWRQAPFLPVPGEDYWRFRMTTAFGGSGEGASLDAADVVAYLQWCRRARPRRG